MIRLDLIYTNLISKNYFWFFLFDYFEEFISLTYLPCDYSSHMFVRDMIILRKLLSKL